MENAMRLDLTAVEEGVCVIASVQLGLPRSKVFTSSRLIEELNCDSLDLVELIMELEDEFDVTVPDQPSNAVGKSVFTRQPFRLGDLAELIYLQQGTGRPDRKAWRQTLMPDHLDSTLPFSQLGGRWQPDAASADRPMFEPLGCEHGIQQFRRRSDGMRCLLLPETEFRIGSDHPNAPTDEQPAHTVRLDSFVIDAEPVSTTAFCRFLNSVQSSEIHWLDWFQLDPSDHRTNQLQIELVEDRWRPIGGTEIMPMVLVSWFGGNAYSRWANGADWRHYKTRSEFLPSEAQWEYAAQGAFEATRSAEADGATLLWGQHVRGADYDAKKMPMAPVHHAMGRSAFGGHHMAGNVWHWCRDWFADDFYRLPESRDANPLNTRETGVRSERGGSWVGPIELCRPSYRRGRAPNARGRCLGFRCVSSVKQVAVNEVRPSCSARK